MTESRAISVVIPTRNRAAILPRALDSLKAQSRTDWEAIVVDDDSSDGTMLALDRYLLDPRIRYLRTHHVGAATARNIGAKEAAAEFLTFLDSDDIAATNWLEEIMEAFDRHGADIVTLRHVNVSPSGNTTEADWVDYQSMFPGTMGNFTHGGTWACKKSLFSEIGGFADGLPASQHTELALRLLQKKSDDDLHLVLVDKPLIQYHYDRPDNIRSNDAAILEASGFIRTRHYQLLRRDPRRLAASYWVTSFRAARLGRRSEARRAAFRAVETEPRSLKGWTRLAVVCLWWIRPRRWRPPG